MTMKRWLVLGSMVASVCGCGVGPSPLAGQWVATQSAFSTTDPARAIFATSQLTISSTGDVTGDFTTIRPTNVVGERGTATGTMILTTSTNATVNLTIAFPTLGTFRVNGSATYAAASGALGVGNATVRDASNAVVGSLAVVYQKQ